MQNLTLLSLTASSIFTMSPFFTKQNYFVSNINFKFYNPILFYNVESLTLQKSFFEHGLGPLIIANAPNYEYHDNNFPSTIEHITEKCLCIIRDCIFSQIEMTDNHFINIKNESSFYLTDCIFTSCQSQSKCFIYLESRSSKISHMCCANMIGSFSHYDHKKVTLFLRTSTSKDSFFKFVYSTIIGNDHETNKPEVLYLHGNCALQFQCNNISRMKVNLGESVEIDRYIVRIISQSCLNMQMNTFINLESSHHIIYINPQDGDVGYKHYLGYTNFFNNKFKQYLIDLSMFDNTNLYICNCVFINNVDEYNNKDRYIRNHQNTAKFSVIDCVFDYAMNTQDCKNPTIINTVINLGATSLELAHFITRTDCLGIPKNDALGCNNNTCPDERGCPVDAFNFKDEDIKYTDKFHSGFNTPTPSPTQYFTESSKFSYSSSFSESNDFTKSNYFSSSYYFSETGKFTKTDCFTTSVAFSESNNFTKSMMFSRSDYFTTSSMFSRSDYFTTSAVFSETNDFTTSAMFSKSNNFTKSMMFSRSDYFTTSAMFSRSDYFTTSAVFSETNNFTTSTMFSKSNYFTTSMMFSRSDYFTTSIYFSHSSYFTKTKVFTETTDFTKSTVFTKSAAFTKSDNFEPTIDFAHTHHFTPSSYFTISDDFTPSTGFSKTSGFTKTQMFTSTDHFTRTKEFSTSFQFSSSFYFTDSDSFIAFSPTKTFRQKNVVIDIKTEDRNGMSLGAKAGIGLACAAAVAGIVIAAIFLLRRRKYLAFKDMDEEMFELQPDTSHSYVTQNPLNTIMDTDDPFEDEFDLPNAI